MYSKNPYVPLSVYRTPTDDKPKKYKKMNGDLKTESLISVENYDSRSSASEKQYGISKKLKSSSVKKKKKFVPSDEEDEPAITLQMDLSECEDEEEEREEEQDEQQLLYESDFVEEEEEEEETEQSSKQRKPRRSHAMMWVDCFDADLPTLELPSSSSDLPIESRHVMQTLGIYEVLRHFSRYLRLTIFRFEDLCMALSCPDQSALIVEVHIALLKHLLRADDSSNFVFGPQDTKDSINIVLNNIDHVTWYEVVRTYLTSSFDFDDACAALQHTSYSHNSMEERLEVLQCLTDLTLSSGDIRNDILTDASFVHEDQCRVCHK